MRHGCLLVMGLALVLLPKDAKALDLTPLPWGITGGTLTNSSSSVLTGNLSVVFGLTTGTMTFTSNAGPGWNWGAGGTVSIAAEGNVVFSGVFNSLSAVITVPSFLGLPGLDTLTGTISGTLTSSGAQLLGLSGPATVTDSSFSGTFSSKASLGKSFTTSKVAGTIINSSISMPEEWGLSYSLMFSLLALGMGGLALRTGVLRSARQPRAETRLETSR